MAADRLPAEVREFANYLDGLLARLDPSGGWCAVFWQRDPEGMRACLDGRETPPWDVVESLLADLAVRYGPGSTGPETEHARVLHAAALAAYDTRPGVRDSLADRLDAMLREQQYAAERQAALSRQLTSAITPDQAEALRVDLAWARDDHARATARCAELRARMAHADRHERGAPTEESGEAATPRGAGEHGQDRGGGGGTAAVPARQAGHGEATRGRSAPGDGGGTPTVPDGPHGAAGSSTTPGRGVTQGAGWGSAVRYDAGEGGGASAVARGSSRRGPSGTLAPTPAAPTPAAPTPAAPVPSAAPTPAPPPAPSPAQTRSSTPPPPTPRPRRRRRGSARFAGVVDEADVPVVAPAAVPVLPLPEAPVAGGGPRGARFAGAAEETGDERAVGEGTAAGDADRDEVARVVETLAWLRGEGRSGEAHALLAEAASWQPARFPLLAERLHRAGLDADWQTLLWEAASLPAGQLVAAADALTAAGRESDARQMLRQGVARPPDEIGRAVLALTGEGRRREVRVLLDAYVTVRTPEEAARSAGPDPRRLVPLLLEAAAAVSDERRWDLVHALRVAGHHA